MEKTDRVPRRYCKIYMNVLSKESGTLLGHMVDVTTQGLMLLSEAPIHPDAIFELEILLPAEVEGVGCISVSAMSRWCKEDENPGFYNTGFEFRNAPPKTLEILEGMIQRFCFKG